MNKPELQAALVDVRKAYRLLYFYQRRVLDTIKYISDYIAKPVASGWPLQSSSSPRAGAKLNLNNWAWDWLNMYFYEFNFGINKAGYHFAIIIQSDTGQYELDSFVEEVDVELYAPVDESSTKLIFFLAKGRWKHEEFYHEKIFSKDCDKYTDNPDYPALIGKSYFLEDFLDDDSIKAKVDDFKSFCSLHKMGDYFKTA